MIGNRPLPCLQQFPPCQMENGDEMGCKKGRNISFYLVLEKNQGCSMQVGLVLFSFHCALACKVTWLQNGIGDNLLLTQGLSVPKRRGLDPSSVQNWSVYFLPCKWFMFAFLRLKHVLALLHEHWKLKFLRKVVKLFCNVCCFCILLIWRIKVLNEPLKPLNCSIVCSSSCFLEDHQILPTQTSCHNFITISSRNVL